MVRQGQCKGMAIAAAIAALLASLCRCVQGVVTTPGDGVDAGASGGADGARTGGVTSAAGHPGGCATDPLHVAAAVEHPNGRALAHPGC